MRQRLAAVMAADIADYTRLMGADQSGTLRALQSFRTETLRPSVASHSGEIIKDMGDGWLVKFSSVAEAVGCALALQEQLIRQTIVRLRIGINIGDVLHEAEDIFGDGVNVAARLQAIAPPGGIALSGAAHDILDRTLAPAFSDTGQHELKNVMRPVHVWMRLPASGAHTSAPGAFGPAQKLTRLAIKPVVANANDQALHDIADSITGDLLRLLNSSDWIGPRISSTDEDTDYTLKPVLRARGDQIRLEAELSSALGDAVWQGATDGSLSESFDWQDRASLMVSANVVGAITDSERESLFHKPVEELSAQECLECAVLEFFEISDEALTSALGFVRDAIEADPDYAPAYVHGVRCLLSAVAVGYRNRVREWLPYLPEWLERAERAEGSLIRLSLCRAIWSYTEDREAAALQSCVMDVLGQAPFDPDVLCLGGWAYVWLGQPDRAIECFHKFERLGQFNSLAMATRAGLATAFVQAGRDAAASAKARDILRRTREFAVPFRALAAASAHLGDTAEAREAVSEALRLMPGDSVAALRERAGFAQTDANTRLFDGLRKAGFPEA